MELRIVRRCTWQVPVISPCESYPKEIDQIMVRSLSIPMFCAFCGHLSRSMMTLSV